MLSVGLLTISNLFTTLQGYVCLAKALHGSGSYEQVISMSQFSNSADFDYNPLFPHSQQAIYNHELILDCLYLPFDRR